MHHNPTTGRFTRASQTAEERFWPKVQKTETCWLWTAAHIPLGYGVFWNRQRLVCAHQFAYELLVGPVPDGYELDHLCRVPACVRPDHLEPVTHRVNMQRGNTGHPSGAQQLAKTHCPQGHPYDAANTYITPSSGARNCRTCRAAWDRAARRRRQQR